MKRQLFHNPTFRAAMTLFVLLCSVTAANAQSKTLPYFYGFENNCKYTEEGWSTRGSAYKEFLSQKNHRHSGTYALFVNISDTSESDDPIYLISPVINSGGEDFS
jgi:hypothetical protein